MPFLHRSHHSPLVLRETNGISALHLGAIFNSKIAKEKDKNVSCHHPRLVQVALGVSMDIHPPRVLHTAGLWVG